MAAGRLGLSPELSREAAMGNWKLGPYHPPGDAGGSEVRRVQRPGDDGHRIACGATTKINRKEFGMTLNMMADGKFAVTDEVQIMIEGELVEQTEPTGASAS
jgi:hypothetical protein